MTGIAPRGAAALFCVGLGLTLGAGSSRSSSQALSFTAATGVITGNASNASVLVDTGSGRFFRVKPQGEQIAIVDAIGDLNGDGKPDLVTHYNDDEQDSCTENDGVEVCTAYVYVSFRRSNGTFRKQLVYYDDSADVTSAAIGDVNRDGKPDLLLELRDYVNGNGGIALLRGLAHGKFQHARRIRGGNPVAFATADLNGDRAPDLITANPNGTVSVSLDLGGTFAAARRYRVGPDPSALAVGDVNGDHRPDLVVTRAGGAVHAVTVLLNRGHGSLGGKRDYQTGTQPASVAIGDLNGDGRPDLVIANGDAGSTSVLLNEGGGAFRARLDFPTTAAFPIAAAIGRFNSDRAPDLVIPAYNDGPQEQVSVLTTTSGACDVQDVVGLATAAATDTLAAAGCGVGTVGHASSTGFAAGRIMSQTPGGGTVLQGGVVDLTVSDGPGPRRLAGPPSFGAAHDYPIPGPGQLVAVADLNGDGSPDVVSGSCGTTVSVLLNRGNGTLSARHDYRLQDCPDSLVLSDLNGDGRPDIVVGDDSANVSVLMNHGDGTFAARQDYEAVGSPVYGTNYVAVGDLNGDGKPDIATANGDSDSGISIFFNNGDGTFAARRDYQLGAGAEAIAIGDLSGDGKADIVVEDLFGTTLILNQGGGNFEQAPQRYPSGGDASDVFVGDLTADGRPDVVVTNGDNSTVQVFLNDGADSLRPYLDYRTAGGTVSLWAAIGDVNGDGTPDLVTAGKSVSLLRNHGDGTFTAKRDYTYARQHTPRGVALADLNGDGKPDLVTANGGAVVVRLHG